MPSPGAELIFQGGDVHPMGGKPTCDAVAVAGGRILAVGSDAVDEVRRPGTEVVDLDGGALLPGFQDAHIHPIAGGLQQLGCDLSDLHDLEAYRTRIHAHADRQPGVTWIQGSGWYGDVFPGGFPDRTELDRLVPDRPATLVSHDAHGIWVNSEALRFAGIDRRTPDPDGGRIVCDGTGEPTGLLMESAADLVTRLVPRPDAATMRRALLQAQSYLHGLGITAWQDAAVGEALGIPDSFETYRAADAAGELTARVTGALWWDREAGLDQVGRLLDRRATSRGGRFRATAVKIMQDGVCENLTAGTLQSYRGHSGNHGLSFIAPADLAAAVRRLDAELFDVHLHAVGDRAVRECLDALAEAETASRDHRHQLAHLDLIDPADVTRMRDLRVIANLQPLWARHDSVLVETKLPYLTDEQRRHHFTIGSLHASDVTLAMGSDWPVSSPDPLWGIHTAVNRTAPRDDPHAQDDRAQRDPLLVHEAVDTRTALEAYTLGAARANRLEAATGTIEVGKAADLVVLDRDPLTVPATELSTIRVRATFVDGAAVRETT